MLFVGRKSEKRKIIESLQKGKNIILGGKYGIGRTSLVKEISRFMFDKRKFVFVDFSQTPGKMSEKLMKELGLSVKLKKNTNINYKSMRYRIANVKISKKQNPVIVFDNITKMTSAKIIFLRHLLLEQHFQFIAIIENFLPKKDLSELKAQLVPEETLILRHLKVNDIENLLMNFANQSLFNWTNHYIHNLAILSDGYPLGLAEMLKEKRKHSQINQKFKTSRQFNLKNDSSGATL